MSASRRSHLPSRVLAQRKMAVNRVLAGEFPNQPGAMLTDLNGQAGGAFFGCPASVRTVPQCLSGGGGGAGGLMLPAFGVRKGSRTAVALQHLPRPRPRPPAPLLLLLLQQQAVRALLLLVAAAAAADLLCSLLLSVLVPSVVLRCVAAQLPPWSLAAAQLPPAPPLCQQPVQ